MTWQIMAVCLLEVREMIFILRENNMTKALVLLTTLLVSFVSWADCFMALKLRSDDKVLYTEEGNVKICVNAKNELDYLLINKPVMQNKLSDQFDERNPTLKITLKEVNETEREVIILTPKRSGLTVTAVSLLPVEEEVDKSKGGEITLKILKNILAPWGKYHQLRLQLVKRNDIWVVNLLPNKGEKFYAKKIQSLFFHSTDFGIGSIDIE